MTVRSDSGRRRYIAFRIDPPMDKKDLIDRLKSVGGGSVYVIQCSEGWAIIRTVPSECDSALNAMKNACPDSESLLTSGTLRTLRERYPELQRLRPPAHR